MFFIHLHTKTQKKACKNPLRRNRITLRKTRILNVFLNLLRCKTPKDMKIVLYGETKRHFEKHALSAFVFLM